ncbi:MAG: sodium:proton antiporter, partial [Xanthobacter sp. 17-67-6]
MGRSAFFGTAAGALGCVLPALFLPVTASAAVPGEAAVKGAELSVLWALPFAGMLLSIALFPLLAGRFWHHHYGKVALFWGACFMVPFALTFGPSLMLHEVVHTAALEYIPFIILLFSLFTVSGGILIAGNIHGTPLTNTGILAFGTLIASLIGT